MTRHPRICEALYAPDERQGAYGKSGGETERMREGKQNLEGGGGGSLGGTLESGLEGALHDMGGAEAADTGGLAVDPTVITPGTNSLGGGWVNSAPQQAAAQLTGTTTERPWETQRTERSATAERQGEGPPLEGAGQNNLGHLGEQPPETGRPD